MMDLLIWLTKHYLKNIHVNGVTNHVGLKLTEQPVTRK